MKLEPRYTEKLPISPRYPSMAEADRRRARRDTILGLILIAVTSAVVAVWMFP